MQESGVPRASSYQELGAAAAATAAGVCAGELSGGRFAFFFPRLRPPPPACVTAARSPPLATRAYSATRPAAAAGCRLLAATPAGDSARMPNARAAPHRASSASARPSAGRRPATCVTVGSGLCHGQGPTALAGSHASAVPMHATPLTFRDERCCTVRCSH
ncbi:forkhead box protein E1-like [Schistocerca cancellata]|uniref:forkhead box protein E1-like n=1 Tax=Schistocerca cancellata TaxID=274614 RepID=UPI0021185E9D|nr:forkhead box protein E1-like [Schistocerca cancellata]